MRIHELAKELNLSSKELIAKIEALGGEAKGHMSLVDEVLIPKLKAAASPTTVSKEAPAKDKAEKKKAVAVSPASVAASTKEAPKKIAEKPAKPEAPKAPEKTPSSKPVVAEPAKSAEKPAVNVSPEPAKAAAPKVEKPVPASSAPVSPAVKAEPQNVEKVIMLRFPITVGNLAQETRQSVSGIIKSLMAMGIFANVNQLLNEEVVTNLAEVLKIKIAKQIDEVEKYLAKDLHVGDEKKVKLRPPVVTMMGHVDHGKTSLLDAIRSANVAASEKGAITQHMGAYGVDIPGKGHVTFLDTPGHEAFTAMRARGANITDIVVLVVAADDGIMPQTVEAIHHAREAGCPIVVAINKIDLPSANLEKVRGQLQSHDLTPEEWGGKTICMPVSAKTKTGISELLDILLLQAEVMELKANPACEASGTVVEAHLTKGSGPVATVIVQRGTLRVGDVVVCGVNSGKVRAMKNDRGKQVNEAGPSYSVSLMGLNGVPDAGESFHVVEDERVARRITEQKSLEKREKDLSSASKHLSLENLYERLSEGDFKELKIIIKVDVQGSLEALAPSLEKLSNDQCQVRVIHSGIGPISESDVMLALASDAVVLGFHVRADSKAENTAQKEGVDLRYYNIIYEVMDDVRKAMEGLLEPTYNEVMDGRVEVRQTFQSSKVGTIGGGYVIKGKIIRNHPVRVLRNNVIVFDGRLDSLKRFKDDARDVSQGYECGLALEGFKDLRVGDIVECYHLEKVATKLS